MFIVLEGLDGAGKSTQIKLLNEYFSEQGKELKYMHFPRYDLPVSGEMVAKFLRGDLGSIESVHPQVVALLFAENRRDAAAEIKKWLAEGYSVLLDRYVYSNIAFQCCKLSSKEEQNELRDWILNTEYSVFNIPKPDLNLFLDVPIGFVDKKLKEERDGDDREYLQGKADIHEADIAFQIKVREIYLEQTQKDKDFIGIDCSDSSGNMALPNEIFAKIKKVVDDFQTN